jgi:hypothetical protein
LSAWQSYRQRQPSDTETKAETKAALRTLRHTHLFPVGSASSQPFLSREASRISGSVSWRSGGVSLSQSLPSLGGVSLHSFSLAHPVRHRPHPHQDHSTAVPPLQIEARGAKPRALAARGASRGSSSQPHALQKRAPVSAAQHVHPAPRGSHTAHPPKHTQTHTVSRARLERTVPCNVFH